MLSVLCKAGHFEWPALKNLVAVVHLLEAHEIEKTLNDCLSQEAEADRFVSALADDMLLMTASSHDETALDALQRYN